MRASSPLVALAALLLAQLLLLAASPAPALLVSAHSPHAHAHARFLPVAPPRAALEDDSPRCLACQAVASFVGNFVTNKTDMSFLLTELKAACGTLDGLPQLLCDGVAVAICDGLPQVPKGVVGAGLYTEEILCSFMGMCSVPCCTDNTPTQIHLSAAAVGAAAGTAMTVTWMTADSLADVQVQWGPSADALNSSVSATTSTYTDGGWIGSIHTATMTGLKPGVETFYAVGGPNSGWSDVASFTPVGPVLPAGYKFIQIGDMGAERNFSAGNQDYINYAASAKAPPQVAINTVLHVGDISYADGYMERWDELFNAMQPTASIMPYMTCPGNHEIYFNFTAYLSRMHMPTVASNATLDGAMYYSWDAGCIHFISLNSEDPYEQPQILSDQRDWLEADLAAFEARRQAGRERRHQAGRQDDTCSYDAPTFAVVYMHRPMYCSVSGAEGEERCVSNANYLRAQVESLFIEYGVDLVFCGHVHAYERTTNVADGVVDPRGPLYVLNGAGGNREGGVDGWLSSPADWSVVRIGALPGGSPLFGLGTLTLVNSTTLAWEWFLQTDLADAVREQGVPKPTDSTLIIARQ